MVADSRHFNEQLRGWMDARRADRDAGKLRPSPIPELDAISAEPVPLEQLERAAWLTGLRESAAELIDGEVAAAIEYGASDEQIGDALKITRQAVAKRWGHVRRGEGRVAVVISRRDRVRHDLGDPRGQYGEVGGAAQYESDRGAFPIGETVRRLARYAIVAVDGVVRRIYLVNPDGWSQTPKGKWTFTALDHRTCTADEIEAAVAAGELPLKVGDSCPTRAGGAYRPAWF